MTGPMIRRSLPLARPLRRRALVFTLIGASLLGACATAPMPAADGARHWSGRLALTVHSIPLERHSAGFDLSGSPEAGELLLHSPLGQTVASLRWNAQGAQWQQGATVIHKNTLQDLAAELGEGAALPVAALFAWLDGQPGRADGWEVDLSQHAQGRISAIRQTPAPRADLRLVVNR